MKKTTSRMVLTATIVLLLFAALRRPAANAASPRAPFTNPGDAEFDQFFGRPLSEIKVSPPGARLIPRPPLLGATPGTIGIDYTPEARCSDNNWSTNTPAACNPQLSFNCDNPTISLCPANCQKCYDADLTNLLDKLAVTAITSYQPNHYILTTAQRLGLKVLQGTFNDAIPSLAASDTSTNCFFSGQPIALCGSKYADAIIDGACGTTTPWDPAQFCTGGPYIEPMDYPNSPTGRFIKDGVIIGIQIGNEALDTTVDGQTVTVAMLSKAAQTLRAALNARGFRSLPIVVSLVLGQEKQFCAGGEPPGSVNLVASHPYCDHVSLSPPDWQKKGAACWDQVKQLYDDNSVADCGASHVFIGETGYNTGCPNSTNVPERLIEEEETFVDSLKTATCAATSPSGFPTFLFAYSDVCPATGCLAGCNDPGVPKEGNGYFGIFRTEGYMTQGTAVAKFGPPSFACPGRF
jgi:hypothetical protein